VPGRSFCEWKGVAHYFDLRGAERKRIKRALSGTTPSQQRLRAALAALVLPSIQSPDDGCWVEESGYDPSKGFYGGWITSTVSARFKGDPRATGTD